MDDNAWLRRLLWRAVVAVGSVLFLAHPALSPAASNEADSSLQPAQQYQKLVKEFETARSDFSKAYQAAKSDAERQKIAVTDPQSQTYAAGFMKLARQNPRDPVAVDALVWVAVNDRSGTELETALTLLRREHLDSEKLGAVCQSLVYSPSPQREEFLKEVSAKNPHHEVQAQACYALALVLKDQTPAQAEKLFNEVAAKYADVKSYRGTLGDAAKSQIYEMQNLAAGKTAPEIEGEDVDGKKFKLSDYRGKVVMLDFWGDW
ncbi:MAG: peroxiredoxin family protein [Limisphaerales bacterium]